MKVTDLKQGFWGYKKESVYQYIAFLNEEFSQKILERNEKGESLVQELQEKNKAQEQEIASLKQQLEEYAKLRFAVSDSIIDAQNYATQLKAETEEKEQVMRTKINDEMAQKRRQMELFGQELQNFRTHLKSVLESMDDTLQNAQEQAEQYAKQGTERDFDSAATVRNSGMFETAKEAGNRDGQATSNLLAFKKKASK